MNPAYRAFFRQRVLEHASGLNSTTDIPRLSQAEWDAIADGPTTVEQLAYYLTSRFKGELHELRMKLRVPPEPTRSDRCFSLNASATEANGRALP